MAKTIAIAHPYDSNKVSLWCTFKKRKDHTEIYVINGAWSGKLYGDYLVIDANNLEIPAEIIWEGDVPEPQSYDYNEAIHWIEQQLKHTIK